MEYSYADYDADIYSLLAKIKQSNKKYDYVVGIKRGGLIPAVCLSHALNIPLYNLDWSTRDWAAQDFRNTVLQPESKILLVDDICDSGKTLITLKELYSFCDIDTAVLIYNVDQIHIPKYYARTINRNYQKEFINFWWEAYK